jgi:tetratricopeptide (TPR) repeat protein
MTAVLVDSDGINFGELPAEIDALLQQGVVSYRRDPREADRIFRQALEAAPSELAVYFCLYKTHTYRGRLDEARTIAERGLREAAQQAGWDPDWRRWTPAAELPDGAGRFALYTLKALAFIHLRMNRQGEALKMLAALRRLDPTGAVGWPVVAALADGLQ